MLLIKRRLPVLALALSWVGAAMAQAVDEPARAALDVSGFATFGVVRSNTDAAQFVRYNQASGATRSLDPGVDSNLGLQATYQFTPLLSATAQALTRQSINGRYRPELTWAFVRYQPVPEWTLRLGRIAVPSNMISDYQNVGYANTMMRPPAEVYTEAAAEHMDGGDVAYRHSIGDATIGLQLAAGYTRTAVVASNGGGEQIPFMSHVRSLALDLEWGPLQLRVSQGLAKVTVPDVADLLALRQGLTMQGFGTLANDLSGSQGKHYALSTLGLIFDQDQWLLQTEYSRRKNRDASYVPNSVAWYLMAGYRLGAWLPYYAHAVLRQTGTSITLPANFPIDGPWGTAVRYGLLSGPEQHSDQIGLRWNLAPDRAVKVQLDRIVPTVKSGTLIDGPAAGLKRPVLVWSAALDVVF